MSKNRRKMWALNEFPRNVVKLKNVAHVETIVRLYGEGRSKPMVD